MATLKASLTAVAAFLTVACVQEGGIGDTPSETIRWSEAALPEPDPETAYLLWNPEEQLIGYRQMERIFPTHLIRAGNNTRPLPASQNSLSLPFEVDGEQWNETTYMERANAVGLIVVKDGEILLERYRQGYGPEQRWVSFSVAKSITSTLVGMAIREGHIQSLNAHVTTYLPELAGSAYEGVTIENLLTMTSGVAWNEDYVDPNADVALIKREPSVNGSDPIVTYMSRLERAAEPGSRWHYNSGETHLVGSLLRAATGQTPSQYLSEKIWVPYGMELDANWITNSFGQEQTGCCVSASLRDFARFGLFFMNGGEIDGVPTLPEGWLERATTTTDIAARSEEMAQWPLDGYGYMWWTKGSTSYQALGIFGQAIHINPDLKLVVVIQSAWPMALWGTGLQAEFLRAVEAAVSAS